LGQSIEEIRKAIEAQALKANVKDPKVFVSLVSSRVLSPIRGEYLIRPDGTIGLGSYGSVRVVGLSLSQTKLAIEQFLAQRLVNPEVSVDVAAYNSKVYYVIYDGGGRGQQVVRLPITGLETVLDAVAQVNGLSTVSSQYHMWIARPSPAAVNHEMILPVDWLGITKSANTLTNYQLLPGDRLYVRANPLIETDNWISMILAPVDRIFGSILLGQTGVQALRNPTTLGGGGGAR
jgi:polysaccharide export outer membrane protein